MQYRQSHITLGFPCLPAALQPRNISASMSKLVAVCGATGKQGGGVVAALQRLGGFNVRALSRNPESASSKKLSDTGVQVSRLAFNALSALVRLLSCRLPGLPPHNGLLPAGRSQRTLLAGTPMQSPPLGSRARRPTRSIVPLLEL